MVENVSTFQHFLYNLGFSKNEGTGYAKNKCCTICFFILINKTSNLANLMVMNQTLLFFRGMLKKMCEQARAELRQAQIKLRLALRKDCGCILQN